MTGDTAHLVSIYLHYKLSIGVIVASTLVSQKQSLRSFADVAPVADKINRRSIEKWMVSTKHLAPGTRRTRYSAIRGFCGWLLEQGVIAKDPTAGIPGPKVPRPIHRDLSVEQADKLVAACHDETDMLIIALGLRMGLRRAEMAGLEMGDIALSGLPTLDVTGKGGHRRRLPIPRDVLAVINRYIDARGITAGPLIRLRRYPERGVQPVWVGRRFSELAYAAGVKSRGLDGVSHHSMRHSLATRIWMETGDAVTVADILGHADLSQIPRYVRSANHERMRAALEVD
jgi:site-specific recombinase XerC